MHNCETPPSKRETMRQDINNRRIINGEDDIIQLYPIKHTFAIDSWHAANANHWLPQEIGMQQDIDQWKTSSLLTSDDRQVVKMSLGFFATADSIVANNVVLSIYRHISSPECRLYLLRQAYEEAIHTMSYQYMIESLDLDEEEIFSMYKDKAVIYNKDNFVSGLCARILDPDFVTGTPENDRIFLENLVDFGCIMEGIFFYASFAAMLSFRRRNLLPGTAEQFQYIMRDESMHMNFAIDLINHIKDEQPELWDSDFERHLRDKIATAAELEEHYAREMMPTGILGMNAHTFRDYTRHIADRRMQAIGIEPVFGAANPFHWMSEAIDLDKEKNFFETRVTEYQTGGALEWD